MRKKSLVFIFLAVTLSITTSGCIDLFHVPGVAVSPDGSRIYFLEGDIEGSASGQLVSAALGGVADQILYAGTENDAASAYAIHPVTGEVAYVRSGPEAGGTSIEIFNPADSSTRTLIGPEGFGLIGIGTMMQFSPDGSRLALTLLALPPDITPESLNADESELTDEQLAAITYRAYMVNIADASLTEIVPGAPTAFNTLDWNTSGTQVALNGWTDANGDGKVVIFPTDEPDNGIAGDSTNVFVYDVAGNGLTQVSNGLYNYAPTYVGDALYWVGADTATEMVSIMSSEGSPYSTSNTITGIAPSPDGSKIVWTETQSSDDSEEQLPGLVYIADGNFANPALLVELPTIGLPDVPAWMPDSQSILVTSTSIISQMITGFTASFSVSTDGESTPEASVESETPAIPTVVQINIATGEITTIYSGAVVNSSIYAGLIGLVASGALDDLMGGTDEE